jgi:methionyl-tRNA formyltransferase
MKIDEGLDTGAILTQSPTPILPSDNAQTLHDRLADLGARLLLETIPAYLGGTVVPHPQPAEGASYARKITREDGRLDWSLPARALWNRVRGLVPWPGAHTWLPRSDPPQLLKIWDAEVDPAAAGSPGEILRADKHALTVACGQQALRIRTVQREGGRRLSIQEFLAGHALEAGQQLGAAP